MGSSNEARMTFGQIRASHDHVPGRVRIGPHKDRRCSHGHGPSTAHDIGHEARAAIREPNCVQASPPMGFEARNRARDLRRDRAVARAADVRQDQQQSGCIRCARSGASVTATSTRIRAHDRPRRIRSILANGHLDLDSARREV
jgi:hypothetical protein